VLVIYTSRVHVKLIVKLVLPVSFSLFFSNVKHMQKVNEIMEDLLVIMFDRAVINLCKVSVVRLKIKSQQYRKQAKTISTRLALRAHHVE